MIYNTEKKETILKKMLYETETIMLANTDNLVKQTECINKIGNKFNNLDNILNDTNICIKKMYGFFTFSKKSFKIINYENDKIENKYITNQQNDEITTLLENIKTQSLIQKELINNNNKSIDQIIKKIDITSKNINQINVNIKKC